MAMKQAILGAGLAMMTLGAAPPPAQLDQPSYEAPAKPWPSVEAAEAERRCREQPTPAGTVVVDKPLLDRRPAPAERPPLEYAVVRKVDGCSVPVLVRDYRAQDAAGGSEPSPNR